ncbi:h domain protein [Rhodococcus sp. UNC363MFTsu5.1]|uniref:h domain protein n=1 Tax=Rhodococcus sp. UNC363MFTsu5.1 TaxID=1449069 RepID=UPI000A880736|nr:h domain protein [Rhodococcus sp. UNC363MFTsu5.1]
MSEDKSTEQVSEDKSAEVTEVESTETVTDASTEPGTTETAPRNVGRTVLAAVAAALVIALAAGVGVLFYQHLQDNQTEQARTDAVAAAGEQAVAMLSYNYNTVDAQLAEAADGLTGSFKDDYNTLVAEVIAPGAKEKKLTVQVTVQGGSIVSADPDDAVVLLFLNQITTSADAPDAATTGSRVRMEMHKEGDRWLTGRLTPV